MNATDATTPVTDAVNAGDVTAIFCPECGDDIEDRRTGELSGARGAARVPARVRPDRAVPGDDRGRVPAGRAGRAPGRCLMAATTARRRLTDEERAERVEALIAELAAAVAALTDSTGWRSMLEVSDTPGQRDHEMWARSSSD